jgi:CheY-like chemotaxis protein
MAKQKILIIDDSKIIRLQVRDMLPQGNFEVLEAKDGLEGIEMISQAHPGLVVVDFFMPNMNGWEVVQRMQADSALSRIPVVMMSGRKEDVVAAVPELFEYFEFLSKPFDAPILMKAIKGAMLKAKERRYARQMVKTAVATAPSHESGNATHQNGQTAGEAGAIAPSSSPQSSEADALIQQLHADIKHLKDQNHHLQAELNALKKQLTQLVSFVRKKLA